MPAQTDRGERRLTLEQEAALERIRQRLEKGWDLGGGKFDRDELYDEISRSTLTFWSMLRMARAGNAGIARGPAIVLIACVRGAISC